MSIHGDPKPLTRRDFLKLGAAVLGGLAITPYVSEQSRAEAPFRKDITPLSLLKNYFAVAENHVLRAFETNNLKTLENLHATDREYQTAIGRWNGETPIYPFLSSHEAKKRFIHYVTAADLLERTKWHSPDWGPDVDHDGVIKITTRDGIPYNEIGYPVDTTSFVCGDFSQLMTNRHGLNIYPEFRYLRTTLPMLSVHASTSYVDWPNLGGAHAFNATYVGNPNTDNFLIGNWLFFEPQNDMETLNPFQDWNPNWRLLDLLIPLESQQYAKTARLCSIAKNKDNTVFLIPEPQRSIVELIESDVLASYSVSRELIKPQDLTGYAKKDLQSAVHYALQCGLFRKDQIQSWLEFSKLPAGFSVDDVWSSSLR